VFCLSFINIILYVYWIQTTDSTMEAVFRKRKIELTPTLDIYRHRTTNTRTVFAGHDGFHTRLYIRIYNAAAVAEGCVHSAVNAPAHVKRGRISAGLIFEKRPESDRRMAYLVFIYVYTYIFFSCVILIYICNTYTHTDTHTHI